ncbi:MAG: hypothetical protein V3V84_07645 [Candidatus Bathyarchaeia archaeon]
MIQAELADGRILEFPDGTDPAVIQAAVKQILSQEPSRAVAQEAPVTAAPTAAESDTLGKIGGGLEAALTVASGAIAEPVAGLAGLAALPFKGSDAGEVVEAVKEGLTFTGGEESQRQLQAIAELVPEPVAEAMRSFQQKGVEIGDAIADAGLPEQAAIFRGLFGAAPEAVLSATGLKAPAAVAKAAETTRKAAGRVGETVEATEAAIKSGAKTAAELFEKQSPAKQRIAKLIEEGVVDRDTAGFSLTETGKVVKDKIENEAITQGFDRGVISSIKQASKADKIKMSKMVNLMEKSKRNPEALQRPSDVVGDTLLDRIKVIRSTNISSGKRIDRIAKGLEDKPVDILDSINQFQQSLDDFDVKIIDDGAGGFKPDFSRSTLLPSDRGPLKEIIRQMNLAGDKPIDGLIAHKMKRVIDRIVTFGRQKTAISSDAEKILKDFRRGIDTSLDETFDSYNKANTVFAETRGALDSIQDSIGQKLDLSGPHADKALGTKLRSLLSNNQNRINLLDSVEEIESVARTHGAGGKLLIEGPGLGRDSLLKQILFADELDSRFGPVARTSFQSQIKQAVTDVGGTLAEAQVSPVTAAIKSAASLADKARGVTDESAFRAMKELLKGR